MIKLDFCKMEETKREKIVRKFCELNLKKRRKLGFLDEWCNKYLGEIDGKKYNFEDVVMASPSELFKLKACLDSNPDIKEIKNKLYQNEDPNEEKYSYVIDTLYKNMTSEAKEYLLHELNVSVCPYCNRNYVYSVKNIHTCELDHFFPKDQYPIFAASFYNLIPCCPSCNRKKADNVFDFYPHDIDADPQDLIKFSYSIKSADYLKNTKNIEVEIDAGDKCRKQVEILELKKIYGRHKDVVLDILRKNYIFPDEYTKSLYSEFNSLFKNEIEIKELIYGVPLEEDKYGKRPLTKLTQDIIKEINFEKY